MVFEEAVVNGYTFFRHSAYVSTKLNEASTKFGFDFFRSKLKWICYDLQVILLIVHLSEFRVQWDFLHPWGLDGALKIHQVWGEEIGWFFHNRFPRCQTKRKIASVLFWNCLLNIDILSIWNNIECLQIFLLCFADWFSTQRGQITFEANCFEIKHQKIKFFEKSSTFYL